MTLPQTFARHELLAKELRAHRISTMTPQHTVNLDSGEYSNTPELLVAAAWSITAARWFYSSEVDFRVAIDKVRSIVPVQASVGPEVCVEDVLQQLKSQMGLGKTSGSEKDLSREFCIVYETGKGKYNIRHNLNQRADDNRYVEAAKSRNNAVIMLSCDARGSDLQINISASENFQLDNSERVGRTVQVLMQQLVSLGAGDMMLTDLDVISPTDLVETWRRNATVPPGVKTPVHRLIQLQTTERPEATAVCSRDGSLTYKELDDLASRVASGLIRMGIKKNTVVPLYFEKSRWMPVALLGVLKAGGVFLQLAKSIPKGRTEAILSVDKPPFALIGTASATPDWLGKIVSVCSVHELLAQNDKGSFPLPESSPGQDAVRLFTSGSTGQPKIIAWTHEALATNCQCIKDCLYLGPETRHFQTASYEFDVSMMETIAVLMAGGCLCLPLEEEGTSCSPRAVADLQGNSAYLTPTIAGGLDPDSVPTLRHLALEGEIVPKNVVSKWAGKVTLHNFYGPAECPLAATCVINPESFRTGFAGKASCSLRWVVDPHNQDKLLSPSAIGELLIEGPILMDRYLGANTPANPFVTPTWLQRGCPGFPGRKGRLYKTGDLVQCDGDGNIVILGRKDTQVQICAERVELSEVEHHVRKYLTDNSVGVVAEMITPAGHSKPILAAFLAIGEKAALPAGERREVLEALTRGFGALEEHVPQTFIPAAYIAVDKIPLTAAGKMNRRALRELGGSMTLDRIAQLHVSHLGVEEVLKN